MTKQAKNQLDPEIVAIGEVYAAMKELDLDAKKRVLEYVSNKFNIELSSVINPDTDTSTSGSSSSFTSPQPQAGSDSEASDEFEGISPAGKKWITRNGIDISKLMAIFSLGIDEIDLVSKTIPGKGKSQRMRHVFLLKGIASYLGSGYAKFTHEQIKEACLHYGAWDGPNFAQNFKVMAAEVSGTKEIGYTLTAKGLSEATNLVKSMS